MNHLFRKILSSGLLIVVMSCFLTSCEARENEYATKNLAAQLLNNKIGGIDIVVLSPETMTRSAVTQNQLESGFHYKVEIRRAGVDRYKAELANILETTKVEKANVGGDIRWGIIFYDNSLERVAAIYIDKFGRSGFIDMQAASFSVGMFDRNVISWLKNNFPSR